MPWFRGDGFRTAVKIIGLGEWGGVGGVGSVDQGALDGVLEGSRRVDGFRSAVNRLCAGEGKTGKGF